MTIEHTVTLPSGVKSRDPKDKGAIFREVVFGRRPTLADQLKIEANSQSALEVQEVLLYARVAITKFGGIRMPVPLTVLLQLDDIDREVLLEGYVEYLTDSLGERVAEPWGDNGFKLAVGLEVDGETYDVVEFTPRPSPLTGHDEVKIERLHGSGLRKELALVSRETVALSQSEGDVKLDGAVAVEALECLDAYDWGQLLRFSAHRRADFRSSRRRLAAGGAAEGAGDTGPASEVVA